MGVESVLDISGAVRGDLSLEDDTIVFSSDVVVSTFEDWTTEGSTKFKELVLSITVTSLLLLIATDGKPRAIAILFFSFCRL